MCGAEVCSCIARMTEGTLLPETRVISFPYCVPCRIACSCLRGCINQGERPSGIQRPLHARPMLQQRMRSQVPPSAQLFDALVSVPIPSLHIHLLQAVQLDEASKATVGAAGGVAALLDVVLGARATSELQVRRSTQDLPHAGRMIIMGYSPMTCEELGG